MGKPRENSSKWSCTKRELKEVVYLKAKCWAMWLSVKSLLKKYSSLSWDTPVKYQSNFPVTSPFEFVKRDCFNILMLCYIIQYVVKLWVTKEYYTQIYFQLSKHNSRTTDLTRQYQRLRSITENSITLKNKLTFLFKTFFLSLSTQK